MASKVFPASSPMVSDQSTVLGFRVGSSLYVPLIGMLPSIGPFSGLQKAADQVDEKQVNRVEAIINSMTTHERNHHEVINGSRRKRIARGSGTTVQEVNNLLRQYAQMKKMFKQMGKPSFARRLAGMKMPGM